MAEKVKNEVVKTVEEEKYPLKDLIENCEALTGYKREIAVGALFDCVETEITTTEFKNIIKKFLNRKVK